MNFFLYVNFYVYVIGPVPVESPEPYSGAHGGQVLAQAVNSRDATLVCLQAGKSSADLGKPAPLQTELMFRYLQVTSGSHRKTLPRRSCGFSEA